MNYKTLDYLLGGRWAISLRGSLAVYPFVVLGAPLTIDADAFKTADGNLEASLRLICEKIHAYGDIAMK